MKKPNRCISKHYELEKEILGEDHPDYANSINSLAVFYEATGNYKKAELMFLEALRIRKEIPGENHPDYATSLNNLAEFYRTTGNYGKPNRCFSMQ
ncbi:MAG: tetratricopeptide repeat protein [Ignavibacteria bacterium]|nr:tetratricopeptide repeat protein [Ignavibacteria bacterium]